MSQANDRNPGMPAFASSEVPLYYQLGTVLREQILSGTYKIGDQLPTEAELVADYGVSRITVRQALKTLEDDQLIRREAGRGTFVTGHPKVPETLQMDGSLDDLMSIGLATSVRLLDLRDVVATREDARAFGVPEGHPLMQCTRLRYFHEEPYSYIVNRIPKKFARQFSERDWASGGIMKALETHLGVRLQDAHQTVRATLADASLARLLKVRIGAPLLSVNRAVRTDKGLTVERVHTYYRGDIFSLNVHMTREAEPEHRDEQWKLKEKT